MRNIRLGSFVTHRLVLVGRIIHKRPKFGAFSRNVTTFRSKFRDIFAPLNLTIKLILSSLFYSPYFKSENFTFP